MSDTPTTTREPLPQVLTRLDKSEVTFTDLSPWTHDYLLLMGWKQSVKDAIAGMKAKLEKEGKSEAEIEAALTAKMTEKEQAILDGTVGIRNTTGTIQTSREKLFESIAKKQLRKAAAKANKSLPKVDSPDYAKVYEKFATMHEAEINRLVDDELNAPAFDLDANAPAQEPAE